MQPLSQIIHGISLPTSRDPRTATGKAFKENPAWRSKWIGLDESLHPEVIKLSVEVEQFCKRVGVNDRSGPRLLVLGGKNGTGKTHAAKQAAKYLNAVAITCMTHGGWGCERTPHAIFCEWLDLAECEPGRASPAWDAMIDADLAVVDDVGADVDRFKSGLPVANLARMLNARERKWTILTTNHPPETWAERFDKRVADRLHRNSLIVELKQAESYWTSTPKEVF